MRRLWALSLAAALVGWSFLTPRLPTGRRVALQAGVGGLLVLVTRAELGLRPPRLWAGLRTGSAVGAAAVGAVAATTRLGPVRASMAARPTPPSAPGWLLVRIPVGTVWAEEAAFRAALAAVASRSFGAEGGKALQALSFGLSHVPDARSAGEPVLPTVLVTAGAGWFFAWLAERSGSLAAPMLAHLAINESGAVAALLVRRNRCAT
ncbi:Rv0804 family intramembrane glutamic endopeptidase [Mycobacterium sp. 050134]|uniref:Rv0804 family intramembrane glutamic endopeptidase n=1 Tax=Mycobacterium sp. 050134 TaxID=3096111 RepID=UPI002EDB7CA3